MTDSIAKYYKALIKLQTKKKTLNKTHSFKTR